MAHVQSGILRRYQMHEFRVRGGLVPTKRRNRCLPDIESI
jgi:hypothetical protein